MGPSLSGRWPTPFWDPQVSPRSAAARQPASGRPVGDLRGGGQLGRGTSGTLTLRTCSGHSAIRRSPDLQCTAVADWVRPLFRAAGASLEWHAARSKGLTTVTYCEENIQGPLEIAREDKAEREGRCSECATCVVAPQRTAPLLAMGAGPTALPAENRAKMSGPARDMPRRPEPRPQAPQAAVKRAAAKQAVKKSVPKKTSSKAAVAKRPVHRSQRGRT